MKIFGKIKDRRIQTLLLFLFIFAILATRLAVLTITHGKEFREISINKRLKRISIAAKRGEIYDRNGKLIAGNLVGFSVSISGSVLTPKQLNEVSISLINVLDKYKQKHIGFPIKVNDGKYYFTYDENIKKWLIDNGYDGITDAQTLFDEIRHREQVSVLLNNNEAQKILRLKGVYLPFSEKQMKFYSQIEKEKFLKGYGLDVDISAKEAFKSIRNRKEFAIDDDISDEDAYKILTVRHEFRVLEYRKYVPIVVAKNLDKKVAVQISEMGMELPGVSIDVYPKRYYPYKSVAAHVLGYMGKISQQDEIDKYIKKYEYGRNALIGKVGLEATYELDLRGEDGWKYIEIDALGRFVRDVTEDELTWLEDTKKPKQTKSGKSIVSTIDIELQQRIEQKLEYALNVIQEGGLYQSPWGDYQYKEAFPNAKTGSVIVVNVNTGEVLAMVNYPSYDVNLFATGIRANDWNKLQSENPKNPLAPRPLYNLSALTAVQPGSVYKMATGFAAMLQGLDPTKKIYADGKIDIGANTFGCWIWNGYRGKHGYIDLYKALEVSCNYYFFDISTGFDWKKNNDLGFNMNTDILLNHSKKLGFDEPSGVEIYEINPGIPDPNKKKKQLKYALNRKLTKIIEQYFPIDYFSNEDLKKKIINEIILWADENPKRSIIVKRLMDKGVINRESAEELADMVKYDYYNQMEWFEGDTLNLSIGQGAHQYTPLQIARYIATIANNGYLNKLTLIHSIDGVVQNKNNDIDNSKLIVNDALMHLRKGMLRATQEDRGTARLFREFPIIVAAKTGTAEKEGLIPPKDEIEYLKENLSNFDDKLVWNDVISNAKDLLIQRNDEIAELERNKNNFVDKKEKEKIDLKIVGLIRKGYLTYESAIRQSIKDLSTENITDDCINQYRKPYDNYAWFASFAPYDNPEIAIIAMIPQGGHGGYAAPLVRDIYGLYFDLEPSKVENDKNKLD